jgi:hypothetical protein
VARIHARRAGPLTTWSGRSGWRQPLRRRRSFAEHLEAKERLREGDPDAGESLAAAAAETAVEAGLGDALARAAESIGFARERLPDRG